MKYVFPFFVASILLILNGYQTRQASAGQKEDYELQERCSKRVLERLKEDDLKSSQPPIYTNHYNKKMNKCFIVVEEITRVDDRNNTSKFYKGKYLYDINEMKWYGGYNKLNTISHPDECEVSGNFL